MIIPPSHEPPEPSWRKPAGVVLILALIAAWAIGVTELIGRVGGLSPWVSIPIYAIAGIIWIVPLRPILLWMETGRFR